MLQVTKAVLKGQGFYPRIPMSYSLETIRIASTKTRCILCQGIGLVDLEFGYIADCPNCYGTGKKYYFGRLVTCVISIPNRGSA